MSAASTCTVHPRGDEAKHQITARPHFFYKYGQITSVPNQSTSPRPGNLPSLCNTGISVPVGGLPPPSQCLQGERTGRPLPAPSASHLLLRRQGGACGGNSRPPPPPPGSLAQGPGSAKQSRGPFQGRANLCRTTCAGGGATTCRVYLRKKGATGQTG